jgi:hypothetical protein
VVFNRCAAGGGATDGWSLLPGLLRPVMTRLRRTPWKFLGEDSWRISAAFGATDIATSSTGRPLSLRPGGMLPTRSALDHTFSWDLPGSATLVTTR